MSDFKAIEWTGKAVRLLDQTLLPIKTKYLTIKDERGMWEAIKMLRVRGAPLIGVAAAYGVYLGVVLRKPKSTEEFKKATRRICTHLSSSRPTAVNLFWALDRCQKVAERCSKEMDVEDCLDQLLEEAQAIHREDEETCRLIGEHGAPLLEDVSGVVTHCNTGALATAGIGTAFGVILIASRKNKKPFTVYADETRPLLQGARLTMWELQQAKIDARLITDSTAASVLGKGLAQAVIVGADRVASNGDAANKIGTMPLAILAKHFKVPFYVAAPLSTFDRNVKDGSEIPIEERGREEVTRFGGAVVAPRGSKAYSPAFDVTPNHLIEGLVTEKGVLKTPYKKSIEKAFKERP